MPSPSSGPAYRIARRAVQFASDRSSIIGSITLLVELPCRARIGRPRAISHCSPRWPGGRLTAHEDCGLEQFVSRVIETGIRKRYPDCRPDIAVIAERRRDIEANAGCSVWVGADANTTKGLGVLSFGDYRVALHRAYDPTITWAAPILVTGPHQFFLLAIWNMRPYQYVWDALAKYRRLLTAGPAVVAVTCNVSSRSMFRMRDGTPAPWREEGTRHNDFDFYLQDLRLVSAYHKYFREIPGSEGQSTLFISHTQAEPHLSHRLLLHPRVTWLKRLNQFGSEPTISGWHPTAALATTCP